MRLVLGIYQKKEEINEELTAQGIEGKRICQVGPFSSRTLALEWMNFMEQQLQPSQIKKVIVGHIYPNTWYGTAVALE
ncbi:hypothetical protein JWJ90_20570 [Desulfobulbus rhabdoformis]|jgi:hypothetical protein|uniref:hypothetical protein n=1 Tax=Desulfobulbus rhabdoformis TaxID=34032 RepID=UPI001963533A|nr:hypothetical protein [Desulfobulbus rhabdoformis]MBM9616664.1 hypothetical protein [Desulfobulbus rhabdoformis]